MSATRPCPLARYTNGENSSKRCARVRSKIGFPVFTRQAAARKWQEKRHQLPIKSPLGWLDTAMDIDDMTRACHIKALERDKNFTVPHFALVTGCLYQVKVDLGYWTC